MNILTFDIEEWFHILDNDSTSSENEWKNFSHLEYIQIWILSLVFLKKPIPRHHFLYWAGLQINIQK